MKKKREIEEEFEWYKRRDNTWFIRHRLSRSGDNKEYRKIQNYYDSSCRNLLNQEEIKYILLKRRYEMKPFYPEGYDRMRFELNLLKILNDWQKLYTKYGRQVNVFGLSSQVLGSYYDLEDGLTIVDSENIPQKYLYGEFSQEEDSIVIRDSDGNIVDTFSGDYYNTNDYEPSTSRLERWGKWEYYVSSDTYISGNAYKSGTVYKISGNTI
jgi:hypothetical protein